MVLVFALSSLIAGALFWTFAEYGLHNWYGHGARGRNEFSRDHLAHHRVPSSFAATSKKVMMAARVLLVMMPLAALALGVLNGVLFALGFVSSYGLYELLHRRIHSHAPRGPYSRFVRKHHLAHHFLNPKNNHGVTSPLWDVVFGTYERPGRIRVPRRQALPWMIDERGELLALYAKDYELSASSRAQESSGRLVNA